jgi:hypothetical protein
MLTRLASMSLSQKRRLLPQQRHRPLDHILEEVDELIRRRGGRHAGPQVLGSKHAMAGSRPA